MHDSPPKRRALGLALLVATTLLWGSTFALMKDGTQSLSPALLLAWRFSLASAALLLLTSPRQLPWRIGIALGVILFASYSLQTAALERIGANRSAFLTGLNVVLVPIFASRLAGSQVPWRSWIACVLAFLGLAVLAGVGSADLLAGDVVGDAMTLAGAALFALYVLVLEKYGPQAAILPLATVQLLAVAACSWVWHGFTAQQPLPIMPGSTELWAILLFLAVAASGGTIVMQAHGQRHVSATDAALVFSLEPPFAAGFSWLWLDETLDTSTWIGGSMILAAMVLSQVPVARLWRRQRR